MEHQADVIIVGTGVAGLFCALQLPKELHILMITKDKAEHSDSYLAQGGISTLRTPEDYDSYFEDTMRAGHYKNNPDSVDVMIRSSPQIIQNLIDFGVKFERTSDGLSYTREGAHSTFRILHHKDITGYEITSKLMAQVQQRPYIQIEEYTSMVDIIEQNHVCTGVVVRTKDGQIQPIYAKSVVLATGGLGGLFQNSTNYPHITGDALAIALKHHIALQDINYIQIHPTTLYSEKKGRSFLISESVRGEGAVLLNEKGERFVDELLPRDVVTKAIKDEMKKTNAKFVYLSMEHMGADVIKKRFPNIYEYCLAQGYDITKEPIPVTPAQHYFMGGIQVDLNSKTDMDCLYAIGETGCNGVHGANRLASNSLLESLVFAKRAALHIKENMSKEMPPSQPIDVQPYQDAELLKQQYKQCILNEIKRKDRAFYDQWCHDENTCR